MVSLQSHPCVFVSQVKYWESGQSEGQAETIAVSSRENHTKLENLRPYTEYIIEVRGYNSAGYGLPSHHFRVLTKKPRMLLFTVVYH